MIAAAAAPEIVTNNPIYLYGTILFLLVGLLLTLVPKVGNAWERFWSSKRRAQATRAKTASDKDDADIRQLKRQVANLEERAAKSDERERQQEQRNAAHMEWDREVYQKALAAGWDITPPPSLF